MSDTLQSREIADPGVSIGRRFVILWAISLALPNLLSTLISSAVFMLAGEAFFYQIAVSMPLIVWASIGGLQFLLLRPYLRRRLLWLIATSAGGFLAIFVGGIVQLKTATLVQSFIVSGMRVPEFLFLHYPAVSVAVGAAAGAALLGFLQSFSLDGGARNRLRWLFASIVSGIAAAILGFAAYTFYGSMMTAPPDGDFLESVFWRSVIGTMVGTVGGLFAYGLITGAVLRRLLIHDAQRRRAALIRQFD